MTVTATPQSKTFSLKNLNAFATWDGTRYTPPGPPEKVDSEGLLSITIKDSQSSPGWNVPKPRYIAWKISNSFKRKPPVPPVFRPPKRPSPPVRRLRSSDKSWERAMRKFGAVLALYFKKNEDYSKKYALLSQKYAVRLENYQRAAMRHEGKLRSKGKRIGSIVPTTNNAYSYTKVTDPGWQYVHYLYQDIRRQPIFPYIEKFVYYERSLDGFAQAPQSLSGESHPVLPPGGSATDLINDATGKALKTLFSKLENANAQVANIVAERAQTYSMMASSIQRLQAFLQSPKKAVIGYITDKGVTKRVANDSLQYAFGVEPLLKDVYDLSQAFSKSLTDSANTDMVKVNSTGTASDTIFSGYESGSYFSDWYTVERKVRVRYMCEYRIDNSTYNALNRFGLVDPSRVLWEVLPWSFVIDWFLPIGSFLSQLHADAGLTFRQGTMSVEVETKRTVRRTYKSTDYQVLVGQHYSGEIQKTETKISYERTVLYSPPLVRLPRFKNPFSLRHSFLSLCLWRQRF